MCEPTAMERWKRHEDAMTGMVEGFAVWSVGLALGPDGARRPGAVIFSRAVRCSEISAANCGKRTSAGLDTTLHGKMHPYMMEASTLSAQRQQRESDNKKQQCQTRRPHLCAWCECGHSQERSTSGGK